MNRFKRVAALVLAISMAGLAVQPADASLPKNGGIRIHADPFLMAEGPTLQPFAHVLFCNAHPTDCAVKAGPMELPATAELMGVLKAVNRRVNRGITPRNDDPRIMGGDVWSLSPKAGDCEDFAITKRHDLLLLGFSSSALRLAEAYTPSGAGHMVLVVSTTEGDVVLNNLTNDVLAWNDTG